MTVGDRGDGRALREVEQIAEKALQEAGALRRAVVEALGLPYGVNDHGGARYPTDDEIVRWVEIERSRVRRMHEAHHDDVRGFCPVCGMYGRAQRQGLSGIGETK